MVNKTVWEKGKKAELANVFLKCRQERVARSNGVRPRENKQVRKKKGEDRFIEETVVVSRLDTTRIAYIVFKLY